MMCETKAGCGVVCHELCGLHFFSRGIPAEPSVGPSYCTTEWHGIPPPGK